MPHSGTIILRPPKSARIDLSPEQTPSRTATARAHTIPQYRSNASDAPIRIDSEMDVDAIDRCSTGDGGNVEGFHRNLMHFHYIDDGQGQLPR